MKSIHYTILTVRTLIQYHYVSWLFLAVDSGGGGVCRLRARQQTHRGRGHQGTAGGGRAQGDLSYDYD